MAVDVLRPLDDNSPDPKQKLNHDTGQQQTQDHYEKRLTPFERLGRDLIEDERCAKELSLGKRIGFYRFRGDLGSGNFAQVKLAIHCLAKEKVAVKILDKTKLDEKTQRLLSREISSMEKLAHPNVIRIYEVLESLTKIYIVMEYAASGELFHKILNEGKLLESTAKKYFSQVVSAVSHMHDRNIIHRDIKAENVFISAGGVAKIGDLGFSTCVSNPNEQLNTFCGSPPYAAPELFKDDHYLGRYVDIWALGVLVFFMVTGSMPFKADTVGKLKKKILEGHYVIPDHVSSSCNFLIRQILRPVPSDRFTISEIMRTLWLEETEFPKADRGVSMQPALLSEKSLPEERDCIKMLHNMGISDEMLKQCPEGCRNNIVGTYRVALHQCQQRLVQLQLDMEVMQQAKADAEKKEKKVSTVCAPSSSKYQQSKFCTIL